MYKFTLIVFILFCGFAYGDQISQKADAVGCRFSEVKDNHSGMSAALGAQGQGLRAQAPCSEKYDKLISKAGGLEDEAKSYSPSSSSSSVSTPSALHKSEIRVSINPDIAQALSEISFDQHKTTNETFRQFLARPYGRCLQNGSCYAPEMAAFPGEGLVESTVLYSEKRGEEGALLYAEKCQSCHEFSDVSGYDTVALSVFSSEWLHAYANATDVNRQMPTVALSPNEATALFNFFQQSRARKALAVDTLVDQVLSNFKNQNTNISDRSILYIWNDFWSEAGCASCHAQGERGAEFFDVSPKGIIAWLDNGKPEELIERLLIRHVEKRLGLGADKPGMPMTMEPIPLAGITLLSTWIDRGCPDLDRKKYCDKPALAPQVHVVDGM